MFEERKELKTDELGWELASLFEELEADEINEMLIKNVPMETLRFFSEYSDQLSATVEKREDLPHKVPNLLLLGYLLRILEDRILGSDSAFDD